MQSTLVLKKYRTWSLKVNIKGLFVGVVIGLFVYNFFQLSMCGGFLVCGGLKDFGVIFPIYLLLMYFFPHVTQLSFVMLYVVSVGAYAAALYCLASYVEGEWRRMRHKPKIEIRKI